MSIRRRALEALSDITERGAYANLRLKDAQHGLAEQDARFLSALVYGTLEQLLYLDHVLDGFVKGKQKPAVRNILRMGCCELLFMHTPSHAAISENVALCREIGLSGLCGFVNAVLRRVDRERDALPALPGSIEQKLSVEYSCPEWIVRMWLAAYGETDTRALLAAKPAGTTVRAQYPCTAEALRLELPVAAVRGRYDDNALLLQEGFDLSASPAFLEGRMTVQSEGAMLLCRALGDCRGKRILDACAAPGGKSAYLASLCGNDVQLTCFELHRHRLELTQKTFERLHVAAELAQRDASIHCDALDASFDAVLLDVPCSGLGLLHEKPDIRYSRTETDISTLCKTQVGILQACAPYVKPGGILVYATCTISVRENENMVSVFLQQHPDFEPDPLPLPFADSHVLQLLPHVHGTDGFFVARMRRCI